MKGRKMKTIVKWISAVAVITVLFCCASALADNLPRTISGTGDQGYYPDGQATEDPEETIIVTAKGSTAISVAPEESANLEVEATGGKGTLTFQWDKNGFDIVGATNPYLTTEPIDHNATYTCTVQDEQGESKSVMFTITVDSRLRIVTSERSYSVPLNQTVQLKAHVEYVIGTVSHQWFYRTDSTDPVLIDGETSETLTIPPVTEKITYICILSDQYGNQTDIDFQIYVDNGLTVSPSEGWSYTNREVDLNSVWNLKINASCTLGQDDISYQWLLKPDSAENFTEIPNAVTDSITTDAIIGPCYYACMVTDIYGNQRQVSYHFTIENHLTASAAGETALTLRAGENVNLSVIANCDRGDPHYQWSYSTESNRIDGAVSDTLICPAKTGYYYCTVTDDYQNSVSISFKITVENHLTASAIGEQNIWIAPDTQAVLTVTGSCDLGGVNYQWCYRPDTHYGRAIEGETYAALTTPEENQIPTWGTNYYCIVSDEYGNGQRIDFSIRLKNTGTSNLRFTIKAGEGSGSDIVLAYTAGEEIAGSAQQAEYGQFYLDEDNCVALKAPQCPESFAAPTGQMLDKWILSIAGRTKVVLPGDGCVSDAAYTSSYILTAVWKDEHQIQYTITDGTVTITRYNWNDESISLPAEIEGCPVTAIAEGAFLDCTSLKEITIPEGMETIPADLFRDFTDLTFHCPYQSYADFYAREYANIHLRYNNDPEPDLVIPADVTVIEDEAFAGTTEGLLVRIPTGLRSISPTAFDDGAVLLCETRGTETLCEAQGYAVARGYGD